MEKSRQRLAHLKIIDEAKLKSPLRHFVEGSITLAFWALWIYWLLPVVTLLLWIFGFRLVYRELIPSGGLLDLINILREAGIIFSIIVGIILGWTYYNYLWFLRRGERRNKKVLICHEEDLANLFHIEVDLLKKAKKRNPLEVMLEDKQLQILE